MCFTPPNRPSHLVIKDERMKVHCQTHKMLMVVCVRNINIKKKKKQ